jgi:alpha-ketoglutarate-dependent taurine dioxygenase
MNDNDTNNGTTRSSTTIDSLFSEHSLRSVGDNVPFVEICGLSLSKIASVYDNSDSATRLTLQIRLRELLSYHGALLFRRSEEEISTGYYVLPREILSVNKAFGYHQEEENCNKEGNYGWNRPPASIPGCTDAQVMGNCPYNGAKYGYSDDCDNATVKDKVTPSDTPTGFYEEGFHSDGIHCERDPLDLPAITSMYCLEAPEKGGETYLVDARGCFERLNEEDKQFARTCMIQYQDERFTDWSGKGKKNSSQTQSDSPSPYVDRITGTRIHLKDGIRRVGRICTQTQKNMFCEREENEFQEDISKNYTKNKTAPCYPLVRVHPETGDESIYVSCANIAYSFSTNGNTSLCCLSPIDTISTASESDSSEELCESQNEKKKVLLSCSATYDKIDEFLGDAVQLGGNKQQERSLTHTHTWQAGDFVMWDNRITLHSGCDPTKTVGKRLMFRIRLPPAEECNIDLGRS